MNWYLVTFSDGFEAKMQAADLEEAKERADLVAGNENTAVTILSVEPIDVDPE